jgi:hypothetical protein
VTDDDGAVDTTTTTVTVYGPPFAFMEAEPERVRPDEDFTLDASTSFDQDGGSLVKYEFDLNNDGTYEVDNGPDATLVTSYPSNGTRFPRVRVQDDEGDVDVAFTTVEVAEGRSITAATAGAMIDNIASAVVGGCPAVAYHVAGTGDIYFTRATSPAATSWPSAQLIVDNEADQSILDLVDANGRAAILYKSAANHSQLWFQRAGTIHGTGPGDWPLTNRLQVVDHFQTVELADMKIVAGNPAFVYTDAVDDFRYRRATAANGSTWGGEFKKEVGTIIGRGQPVLVDHGGVPGFAVPVLFASGPSPRLIYAKAQQVDGSAWDSRVEIPGPSQFAPSMVTLGDVKMIDGQPAVVYSTATELYYQRAIDNTLVDWSSVSPGPAGSGSLYMALVEAQGVPWVGWEDGGIPWVSEGTDAAGPAFETPEQLDSAGGPGPFMSGVTLQDKATFFFRGIFGADQVRMGQQY